MTTRGLSFRYGANRRSVGGGVRDVAVPARPIVSS